MTKDVKKKKNVIADFLNVKLFQNALLIKKNAMWYIYTAEGELMSEEAWKDLHVEENYVIATDQNEQVSLFQIDNSMLSPIIEKVQSIEYIERNFFIVKNYDMKALYRGKEKILEYGEYEDFEIDFKLGLIFIKKSGRYGVANMEGNRILSINYDEILPLEIKKAKILVIFREGKWGVYKLGKGLVIPCQLSMIEIRPNYIECFVGEKMGIYDFDGNQIIPIKYLLIKEYGGKVFKVAMKKGKKYVYGAFDLNGKMILSCQYYRVDVDLAKGKVKGVKFITCVAKDV